MKCGCHSHNGFVLDHPSEQMDIAQQISLEGLTPLSDCVRVDRSVSVSALVEGEGDVFHDEVIDQQYRRFIHGSS